MNYSNLTKAELIKLLQDRDSSTQACPDLPKIERGQIWRDSEHGDLRLVCSEGSGGFCTVRLNEDAMTLWNYRFDHKHIESVCGELVGTVELPEEV